MKKHKIIDAIFFYDEIDVLILRLTELYNSVDHFIIMESGIDLDGKTKQLVYKENEFLFEKWKDKITYLSISGEPSLFTDELYSTLSKIKFPTKLYIKEEIHENIHLFLLTLLYQHLNKLDLYVEDLIMVSDVEEIPDLSNVSQIIDKVVFSRVILRQKHFIWSTKFINTSPSMGTICQLFSNLILSPRDFFTSYLHKDKRHSKNFEVVDSGYCFSYFDKLDNVKRKLKLTDPSISDKCVDDSFNNLISIPTESDKTIYRLEEYFGELPKNIHLLENQPIGREFPKNHLVLINSDINVVESKYNSFNDLVYLINFTDDPKVSFKVTLSDRIIQYNILIPNSKYYDILIEENTLENFQKMFGVNEIDKIISVGLPLSKDLFTFANGDNFDNTITFPWSELKEGFIYDKISKIL